VIDVDVRASLAYRSVFVAWFVPSALLMKYFVVRYATRLRWWPSIAADLAMAVGSWLLVVRLPLAIVGWAIIHAVLDRIAPGHADPYSWMSFLVLSAIIAMFADVGVLAVGFRQTARSRTACLLLAINLVCVALAAWMTPTYVRAHPPIA